MNTGRRRLRLNGSDDDDVEEIAASSSSSSSHCPVREHLGRMGLVLREQWLLPCLDRLAESKPGFGSLDVAQKAELCFEQFLLSDMNYSGGGGLPDNLDTLHLVDLPGPYVLQVDEIVNISCALRGRYQNANAGIKRCLKLSMTDGFRRVFGMEYRPIKDLQVLAEAGFKVALSNVHIRHGLLMLVPEAIEVLGGKVNELEAARQRLVNEVHKPPRGRRMRTEVQPLVTRAAHAAWAVNDTERRENTTEEATESHAEGTGHPSTTVHIRSSLESSSSLRSQNATSSPSSNFISDFDEMRVDTRDQVRYPPSVPANMNRESESINREAMVPDPPSDAMATRESIQIDDDEVEDLGILHEGQEMPFTYLASLSAKWATMRGEFSSVQGKVKCFLTGVKGFQYKQRTRYELLVYVDDGSLISEVLIDHDVVQNGIGHTPEEVTAALSCSDKSVASGMKEKLKQFQFFLVNFEGIMLFELNKTSHVPIARQMAEGCNSSDAWSLLKRLGCQSLAHAL